VLRVSRRCPTHTQLIFKGKRDELHPRFAAGGRDFVNVQCADARRNLPFIGGPLSRMLKTAGVRQVIVVGVSPVWLEPTAARMASIESSSLLG
jgi:hypothetical protein